MEIFGDAFIPVTRTDSVRRCPRCVWSYLKRVTSSDETHLLCESCGHCWQLKNGGLHAVNVLACRGCAARAQHDCINLLHDEFPRFGAQLAESLT
jgi:hypothetical protein